MTKFVVFDTETTGLFRFRDAAGNPVPADDPSQPRLASFAAIVLNDDFTEATRFKHFIKPDGWEMSEGASQVNGLTTEFLHEHGVPVGDVLDQYCRYIDDSYCFAAFNAQFDLKMMRGELRRLEREDRFEDTLNICLMRACTDICCVPSGRGRGFKFPKLSEACDHFGIVNEAAHDAMGDAQAAYEVLLKLHEIGRLPEAKVHYAKTAA